MPYCGFSTKLNWISFFSIFYTTWPSHNFPSFQFLQPILYHKAAFSIHLSCHQKWSYTNLLCLNSQRYEKSGIMIVHRYLKTGTRHTNARKHRVKGCKKCPTIQEIGDEMANVTIVDTFKKGRQTWQDFLIKLRQEQISTHTTAQFASELSIRACSRLIIRLHCKYVQNKLKWNVGK